MVLALLAVVAGVYASPLRDRITVENVRAAMQSAEQAWYGPPVYILAFAVAATLLVPATVFVIVGALIWGWVEGGVYAVLGGTLGAFFSYAIARWLDADLLHRFGDRGRVLATRLRNAGFRTLLLMRLIPLFPYAAVNYGSGFAGLRARDFVAATAIGSIPAMFIIAYSADAIVRGSLTGRDAFWRILVAGVLLAALALVPMALRRRAGKAMELGPEP